MIVNNSLRELYISDNSIGDSGISVIGRVLNDCKINKLDFSGCGITFTGAKSLSAVLLYNQTIIELVLCRNPITVEGALLIVKSAVYNTVCQCVWIDDEYEKAEVRQMLTILEDRNIQEVRM